MGQNERRQLVVRHLSLQNFLVSRARMHESPGGDSARHVGMVHTHWRLLQHDHRLAASVGRARRQEKVWRGAGCAPDCGHRQSVALRHLSRRDVVRRLVWAPPGGRVRRRSRTAVSWRVVLLWCWWRSRLRPCRSISFVLLVIFVYTDKFMYEKLLVCIFVHLSWSHWQKIRWCWWLL